MANVSVDYDIKYRIVRKSGNKEVSQRFTKENGKIILSQENFCLLMHAISGAIDLADGEVE